MTAAHLINQLKKLPRNDRAEVQRWLNENAEESEEMIRAIDDGLRSLAQHGPQATPHDELSAKVRQWAGGSR